MGPTAVKYFWGNSEGYWSVPFSVWDTAGRPTVVGCRIIETYGRREAERGAEAFEQYQLHSLESELPERWEVISDDGAKGEGSA